MIIDYVCYIYIILFKCIIKIFNVWDNDDNEKLYIS